MRNLQRKKIIDMIVTKDPAIAGSIKNIWKKSFNLEDPRYIDFFFRDIF